MKTRERTVYFYDLELQASTKAEGIKSPSNARLADLLEMTRKCVSLPLQTHRTTTSVNMLNDWAFDAGTGTHALLFNRADTAVSDVSFRNTKSQVLRKANKTAVEGIEVSSHVLVCPSIDGLTAVVLMTMGAGISISHIARVLNAQWRAAAHDPANEALFNFAHPSNAVDSDGKPVTYKVSYRLNWLPHAGVVLTEALRMGEFVDLELVRHENAKFDQGGNLRIKSESLRVGVGSAVRVTAAMLTNAIQSRVKGQSAKDRYDEARIRYKRRSGGQQTARLALDDLDAAFARKEKITFNTDVDAQQTKLNPTIVAALQGLL